MKQWLVLLGIPALVLVVGGVAGVLIANHHTAPTATAAPPASPTTTAAAAYSAQCRLAILDWSRSAQQVQADLAFGAPDHARSNNLGHLADEITVYCSSAKALAARVANINYRLALGEAHLVAGMHVAGKEVRSLEGAISDVRSVAS